jgi:hypothetical protein
MPSSRATTLRDWKLCSCIRRRQIYIDSLLNGKLLGSQEACLRSFPSIFGDSEHLQACQCESNGKEELLLALTPWPRHFPSSQSCSGEGSGEISKDSVTLDVNFEPCHTNLLCDDVDVRQRLFRCRPFMFSRTSQNLVVEGSVSIIEMERVCFWDPVGVRQPRPGEKCKSAGKWVRQAATRGLVGQDRVMSVCSYSL